jgi:hypothetical protein
LLQNIFVFQKTPSWWVKIGDFGIAKRVKEGDGTELRTATGTQGYEAPEIRGYVEVEEDQATSVYTNVVDIWSFGCVIYKIMAKQVPFQNGREIKRFCDNRIAFPAQPLQGKLTTNGIAFLRSVLVPKPLTRPTAELALQHPWLLTDADFVDPQPQQPEQLFEQPINQHHSRSAPPQSESRSPQGSHDHYEPPAPEFAVNPGSLGQLQPQDGGGPIVIPPLTPEKVSIYSAIFEDSCAQDGIFDVLPGQVAKSIFERAKLPNVILGTIWNLVDLEDRGALLSTEFITAMHLITCFKSGLLKALPLALPAELFEAAARAVPPGQQNTGASAAPLSSIPWIFDSINRDKAGSPLDHLALSIELQAAQVTGQSTDWAIALEEKSQFDILFAGLDKANKGFVTGDEVIPFFRRSRLPLMVLGNIWDLVDIKNVGYLTRDEFAVAMYLIGQLRSRREPLPSSLPPNLVPPIKTSQVGPFEPSASQISRSSADDVFGLETPAATWYTVDDPFTFTYD